MFRLYSAWKNKYVDMPSTCKPHTDSFGHTKIRCDPFFDKWVRIGMDIHKYYSLSIPNTPADVLRGVTWPMFRDSVLAHAVSDKHWAAQVSVID